METEKKSKNILNDLWRKNQQQQRDEIERIFKLNEKRDRDDNSDKNEK